jgi:hypothetical protein
MARYIREACHQKRNDGHEHRYSHYRKSNGQQEHDSLKKARGARNGCGIVGQVVLRGNAGPFGQGITIPKAAVEDASIRSIHRIATNY